MDDKKHAESAPKRAPDPALKRLSRLVGVWDLTGRTLDAQEDNIRGRTAIAWLPGRYFLELRGKMEFMGETVLSLEIVGYDPKTNTFPATVYSNMDGAPARYWWDVQGDVVTHWTEGTKYTGSFGDEGKTLSGGWRPDEGREGPENIAYDATMTCVEAG
jgi:hypothetical protein